MRRITRTVLATLPTLMLTAGAAPPALAHDARPQIQADAPQRIVDALASVRGHEFHPLDERDFTIDRELKRHGIAQRHDPDGRVLLLAVRDIVREGLANRDATARALGPALKDSDSHVRLVVAQAIGILDLDELGGALLEVLREDDEAIVRSQAAVSLGQLADAAHLEALRQALEEDRSADVRHQIELAIDRTQKGKGVQRTHALAYASLLESTSNALEVGKAAPEFTLPDTEGQSWSLGDQDGWVVLVWIFADWCPVCHGEFRELIEMRERFEAANVSVATVEAHDTYRSRVITGVEIEPEHWFADRPFTEAYVGNIWWPHLVDHAGIVGALYGVEPMAYAVHAEYVNRPATIIIDPEGVVRFAYYGTFWGDRPSIEQTLEMIQAERFEFESPRRLRAPDGQGE